MSTISTHTKAEFQKQVLENDKPVLVDFWAEWCGPCKFMEPILESLSETMKDSLVIAKIDIEEGEENGLLAQEMKIQSIPNMVLFYKGQVVKSFIGARSQEQFHTELSNEILALK